MKVRAAKRTGPSAPVNVIGVKVCVGVEEMNGVRVGLMLGVGETVRVRVIVGVTVIDADGVSVGEKLGVGLIEGVGLRVAVSLMVGVTLAVALSVAVSVIEGVGDTVAVSVAVEVSVPVGEIVSVGEMVAVSVIVGVSVKVGDSVGVNVTVKVSVIVGVSVGVSVSVSVKVNVGARAAPATDTMTICGRQRKASAVNTRNRYIKPLGQKFWQVLILRINFLKFNVFFAWKPLPDEGDLFYLMHHVPSSRRFDPNSGQVDAWSAVRGVPNRACHLAAVAVFLFQEMRHPFPVGIVNVHRYLNLP